MVIHASSLLVLVLRIIEWTQQGLGFSLTLLIPGVNGKERSVISLYNRRVALPGDIHNLPVPQLSPSSQGNGSGSNTSER